MAQSSHAGPSYGAPRREPLVSRADELAGWLRERLVAGAQLSSDSRRIDAGDGFLAYPGARHDGRAHLAQALGQGARAVLWEHEASPVDVGTLCDEAGCAHRAVSGLKALAGPIAAAYYERPAERLALVGVTGTNGKTSCTQWVARGWGERAAVIGTLGSGVVHDRAPLDAFGLTTPDAVSLQRMLARFVAQGVTLVAIEASSIGLHQGRLDGATIRAAVFTNLTHDHLDYHGTMDEYARQKARLFAMPGLRTAIVNLDDPAASRMLLALDEAQRARGEPRAAVRRIGYTLATATAAAAAAVAAECDVDARLCVEAIAPTAQGQRIDVGGDFGRASVELSILGRFNASNALAVAATWLGLGMAFDDAIARLRTLAPVPGRMQAVPAPADAPLVVVDYAHTPDALENALATLRPLAGQRGGALWCLFGAGGDRDPSKRPRMGAIAERLADRVVLTSDNPRSEPPLRILDDIRAGLARAPHRVAEDRGEAIRAAVAELAPADVLLVAGKGHEDYQEIGGQRLPFSDVEVAAQALRARGAGGGAARGGTNDAMPGRGMSGARDA